MSAPFEVGGQWIFTGNAGFELAQTPIASTGGALGSFLVIQAISSAPSTPITSGYGILYVSLSGNYLEYTNSTGTTALTGPNSSGWQIGSNTLSMASTFGSLNAFDVILQANSVEIARLVNTTGAFQVAANATIGGTIPASVITGNDTAGALVLSAQAFALGEPNAGTIALGGSTNPQFANDVVFIAPSGGMLFINSVMSGPYAAIYQQGLILGGGDPSNFGNATNSAINIINQTTNPTTVGSGWATIYVGTDNDLHFLNNSGDYNLIALTANNWTTSASNTGPGLKLGNADSNPWSIEQDGLAFITLSTGTLAIGTTSAVTTLNLGGVATLTTLNGSTINVPNLPNSPTSYNIFYNPSTYALSYGPSATTTCWNVTGTNTGASLFLGTTSTDGFTIQQNATPFISFATGSLIIGNNTAITTLSIGNTAHPVSFSFNGFNALGGGNITLATANGNVTIYATSGLVDIDSFSMGSITIGSSGATTSIVIGSNPATTTLQGNITQIYGTVSMDIDSAAITIGDIDANTIAISNTSATTTMYGSIQLASLVSQSALTMAITNTQPAGWATVIINTSTNELAYYVQS